MLGSIQLKIDKENYVDILPNKSYNEYNNNYIIIANLNPFRYRGYYYDTETGLYYLNSRYYDPELGRFVNADDVANLNGNSINGLNLYSYCFGNPIKMLDTMGNIPFANILTRIFASTPKFSLTESSWVKQWIGYVSLSASAYFPTADAGFFYAYNDTDVTTGSVEVGADINTWNWLGAGVHAYLTDKSIGASIQITPWFYSKVSIGFDGLSLEAGININNTTYTLNIDIGIIPIVVAAVVAAGATVGSVRGAVVTGLKKIGSIIWGWIV